MTTEQSASMDAALNDVFSPGRGRHEDAAPKVEAEAIPTPAAAPTADAAPPPEAQREDPVDHNKQVSVKEVFEEREKKRAYKAQYEAEQKRASEFEAKLQALQEQNERLIQGFTQRPQHAAHAQPQQQPRVQLPDPFTDPEGYVSTVLRMRDAEFEQRRLNDRLNLSEDRARDKHGDGTVDAAFQAAQTQLSPADIQRLMQTRHPYDELVKWHKSQTTLQTIGGDVEAFRKKIEEEARAKVLEDLKAGRISPAAAATATAQQAQQPQHFPGTIASATQQGATGQITKTLEAATGDVFSPDRKVRGMRR